MSETTPSSHLRTGVHLGDLMVAALARHARDGRPDQPDADQAEPVEEWFSHA